MDVTEVPPQQGADDLLAIGWAAPSRACDPNATITRQAAVIVELAARNDHLAAERGAALETAAREHAENERLTAENRALRERVAGQHDTIRQQRAAAGSAAIARAGEALDGPGRGPCACLADAAPAAVPARRRWAAWVRTAPRRSL